MRELKADLELCRKVASWESKEDWVLFDGNKKVIATADKEVIDYFAVAREGWPQAIKRAIDAEEMLQKIAQNIGLVDYIIADNCQNKEAKAYEICMKCNACERFKEGGVLGADVVATLYSQNSSIREYRAKIKELRERIIDLETALEAKSEPFGNGV